MNPPAVKTTLRLDNHGLYSSVRRTRVSRSCRKVFSETRSCFAAERYETGLPVSRCDIQATRCTRRATWAGAVSGISAIELAQRFASAGKLLLERNWCEHLCL